MFGWQNDDPTDHREGDVSVQQPRGDRHRTARRRAHHLTSHHHPGAHDYQDAAGKVRRWAEGEGGGEGGGGGA